jgi:hypothetical protein
MIIQNDVELMLNLNFQGVHKGACKNESGERAGRGSSSKKEQYKMRNSSLTSLDSSFDAYGGAASAASGATRRTVIPIRELDFESRIMFNAKLPKKKPFYEQLRKNDFIIDLNNYNNKYGPRSTSSGVNNNFNNTFASGQQQPQLIKSIKNCFTNTDDHSEIISTFNSEYENTTFGKEGKLDDSNENTFKASTSTGTVVRNTSPNINFSNNRYFYSNNPSEQRVGIRPPQADMSSETQRQSHVTFNKYFLSSNFIIMWLNLP